MFTKSHTSFIIVIIICFIVFTPHYNLNADLCIFGNFYTELEAKTYLNTNNNNIDDNNNLSKDNDTLKSSLNSLTQKLAIKNKELENFLQNNNKYQKDIQTLKFKLQQQHDFYEVKEKKQEQKKKTEFAQVSKKTINLKRPEIGNMFSKSLKKTSKK
jgi:hypothetical protein